MNKNENIQVVVDTAALMKRLKFAFTNKSNMIAELIQNSRRSGASKIDINYDEEFETLTIEDDGCGIDNFQSLLSVATSGWDEKTVAEEKPFGMGWLSVLYQAENITIESKGKKSCFNSEDALDLKSFEVIETGFDEGKTKITLKGYKEDVPGLIGKYVAKWSIGFPVPVSFNGEVQSRDDAINGVFKDKFVETPVGIVVIPHLHFTDKQHERTIKYKFHENMKMYYQGLVIYNNTHERDGDAIIVHLDVNKFNARAPDREKLIDEEVVLNEVRAVIKDLYLKKILSDKEDLIEADFFKKWLKMINLFKFNYILNDMDTLPVSTLSKINSNTPLYERSYESNFSQFDESFFVTKDYVMEGSVLLCKLPEIYDSFENTSIYQLAAELDYVVIDCSVYDKNHWVRQYVIDMSNESFRVQIDIHNQQSSVPVSLNQVWDVDGLILCDSYELISSINEVEFKRVKIETYPTVLCLDSGDFDFVVPKSHVSGFFDSEDMLRMVSSYYDDDRGGPLDNELEEDASSLKLLIQSLLNTNHDQIIKSILRSVDLSQLRSLAGKSFNLSFDENCQPTVELIK